MFQRKLNRGTLELWTEKVSSLMRLSQERQFRSSSLSLHREKSNLIFIHSAPVPSFFFCYHYTAFLVLFTSILDSFSSLFSSSPPICLRATRPLNPALRANGQHSNGAARNTCMPQFKKDLTRVGKYFFIYIMHLYFILVFFTNVLQIIEYDFTFLEIDLKMYWSWKLRSCPKDRHK